MRAKKKRDPNEDTAFDYLLKETQQDQDPVNLQTKVRKFDIKRSSRRENVGGNAVIYDLREKLLSKAEFKNISPDGVSFEILPIGIKENDDVFINFASALNLGMVLCTVQWVRNIPGHRNNHKLVGLRFKKLTAIKHLLLEHN